MVSDLANRADLELQTKLTTNSASKIEAEIDDLTGKKIWLVDRVTRLESSIPACEVRSGNAIWSDKRFSINQGFVATIEKYYGEGCVRPVDFRENFDNARKRINAWCAEQTNNRIKDAFPPLPEEQARSMAIALTNTVYFRADWETKFDKGKTKNEDFTCFDGAKVKLPIMHGPDFTVRYGAFEEDGSLFPTPEKIKFRQTDGLYPEGNGFSIVELPYRGNDVSMVLVAPNRFQGLKVIEDQLSAINLSRWLEQLKSRQVNVHLPKFKYEATYDFKDALKAMGVNDAFATSADFSGLVERNSDSSVYLGMVRHKTFIEVNETSTEAAAATFMGGLFGSPPTIPFVPDFRADRPFLYIIRDVGTGTVLFVGRMTKP